MNPANYMAQNPYAYMAQGQMPPQQQQQQQFHPAAYAQQFQGGMMPQGYPQQHPAFMQQQQQQGILIFERLHEVNADSRAAYSQSPTPQLPSSGHPSSGMNSAAPTSMSPMNGMMQQQNMQNMQMPNLAQQAQMQNAVQAARPVTQPQATPAMSPQSQQRERARVTVLLDINTALLQEVLSLQAKGMAGPQSNQNQQSPSSPNPSADSGVNNSPTTDASKGKPASQEYNDCMRRLQANLSYLATIADAKKKTSGPLPTGPAIMIPPPHLVGVHDLYKKLNQLFPEASQSTINKAMAYASAQASKQAQAVG